MPRILGFDGERVNVIKGAYTPTKEKRACNSSQQNSDQNSNHVAKNSNKWVRIVYMYSKPITKYSILLYV